MEHTPGFLALTADAIKRIQEASVEETGIKSQQKDVFLIDVRETEEWEAGHAKNAIHLSKGIIERDVERLIPDKQAAIYCYCGGGYRSALVADNLQKMGYKNVKSVRGGYRAWVEGGLPINHRPIKAARSPYEKIGGIVYLPRFIDKAKLLKDKKLPEYEILISHLDKILLDFLCLESRLFEEIVLQSSDDHSFLSALKEKLRASWPTDNAISEFNERFIHRRPETPEKKERFDKLRSVLPSTKKKIETYFDLIDLEEGRFED